MSDTDNRGVINMGSGTVSISNTAVGDNATVNVLGRQPTETQTAGSPEPSWDIGVITVLSEETSAVTAVLKRSGGYHKRTHPTGIRFHESRIIAAGLPVTIVAVQALDLGQRPVIVAFESLRRYYSPRVVALVGIGGGIHSSVALGDVVVAQEVIYYDMRKETPEGVRRRGQSQPVPAVIRRALNNFFSDHNEPFVIEDSDPDGMLREYRVYRGPIGSGEAVVADSRSAIRDYLASYNDKVLALETEAGGLSHAFYEAAADSGLVGGWLAIRGISDHADSSKDDTQRGIASWHAAAVFERLLPYLRLNDHI